MFTEDNNADMKETFTANPEVSENLKESSAADLLGKENSDGKSSCEKKLETIEMQIASCIELIKNTAEKNNNISQTLKEVADIQGRCESKIVQNLKENSEFRVQVRQGMQHDIDELKTVQSGEYLNPLLKEIAGIYSDYYFMMSDKEISPKMKNNLSALFEQIADLLCEYGAEVSVSKPGTPRNMRTTKIIHKVPTENQAQHNTGALSRKPGIIKGRAVLSYETLDVYVYAPGANAGTENRQMPLPPEPPEI